MATELDQRRAQDGPAPTSVFDRVVCLVDGSTASLRAARLAARVTAPDGRLDVVALDDGAHHLGRHLDEALAQLERRAATLVVVTLRERSRAVGIAHGSLATHMLHDAPCSVLVVPEAEVPDEWPTAVAVGLDGSPESAAAAAAGWAVAERFGARLRAVAATGRPGHANLELVRRIVPEYEEQPTRPVTALAEASEDVDLVVVGSRGLRGVRALGSVSERVAHEAHCPVLVVRPTKGGPR